MIVVNDDSSIINKWSFKLIDDARVVIYDRNMFIIQATAIALKFSNQIKWRHSKLFKHCTTCKETSINAFKHRYLIIVFPFQTKLNGDTQNYASSAVNVLKHLLITISLWWKVKSQNKLDKDTQNYANPKKLWL